MSLYFNKKLRHCTSIKKLRRCLKPRHCHAGSTTSRAGSTHPGGLSTPGGGEHEI